MQTKDQEKLNLSNLLLKCFNKQNHKMAKFLKSRGFDLASFTNHEMCLFCKKINDSKIIIAFESSDGRNFDKVTFSHITICDGFDYWSSSTGKQNDVEAKVVLDNLLPLDYLIAVTGS